MSDKTRIDVIYALFDAWHARDLDKVATLLTPDFEYVTGDLRMSTVDRFLEMARTIWVATPDERVELARITDDGKTIAIEARTTAHQNGPLRFAGVELPPSGRWVDIWTAYFFTFRDGLIHRWTEYGNTKDWVEQMGATVTVTPGPAA